MEGGMAGEEAEVGSEHGEGVGRAGRRRCAGPGWTCSAEAGRPHCMSTLRASSADSGRSRPPLALSAPAPPAPPPRRTSWPGRPCGSVRSTCVRHGAPSRRSHPAPGQGGCPGNCVPGASALGLVGRTPAASRTSARTVGARGKGRRRRQRASRQRSTRMAVVGSMPSAERATTTATMPTGMLPRDHTAPPTPDPPPLPSPRRDPTQGESESGRIRLQVVLSPKVYKGSPLSRAAGSKQEAHLSGLAAGTSWARPRPRCWPAGPDSGTAQCCA
jgi:hypothetical protein